jgi:hypothetical protein
MGSPFDSVNDFEIEREAGIMGVAQDPRSVRPEEYPGF